MSRDSEIAAYPHERDYIERTIATVRNHRDADNCWPQWANIFANEIERLWEQLDTIHDYAQGEWLDETTNAARALIKITELADRRRA